MAGIATPTSRCFHSPAGLSIPAVLLHLMFSLTDVVHCGKLLIIFFFSFSLLILLSLQSFIFLTNSTSGMESEMRNLCIIHWQIIIQHNYILLYWCLLILNACITYIYVQHNELICTVEKHNQYLFLPSWCKKIPCYTKHEADYKSSITIKFLFTTSRSNWNQYIYKQ